MNSCIYIDGIALYVITAIVLFAIFTFIIIGNAYLKSIREIERLSAQKRSLARELSEAEEKLYKASFKTPEVDKNV